MNMIWKESDLEGRVEVHTFESDVLQENPLGDPANRDLHVYLPPEYDATDDSLPVLYILSGFGSSSKKYLSHSTFAPAIHHQYEEVRDVQEGGPAILVFPDCKTSLGGAQYMDSPAVGSYKTYLIKEIVPWIDRHYRTETEPRNRGVFGKSSGGYGALRLAIKHPEVFGVVGCHSGDMYFQYCYLPDFPVAAEAIREEGSAEAWLESFRERDFQSGNDFKVFQIIAMSACYSPDPQEPGEFVLPFDLETGAVRDGVWEQWLEEDPVRMVRSLGGRLRELEYLFFDCGSNDEYNLQVGARVLHEKLRQQGIEHEYEEFDGGHRGTNVRYPVFLRKLTSSFYQ